MVYGPHAKLRKTHKFVWEKSQASRSGTLESEDMNVSNTTSIYDDNMLRESVYDIGIR